jgi:hypothetical protein
LYDRFNSFDEATLLDGQSITDEIQQLRQHG